jgi:hypothetical protein
MTAPQHDFSAAVDDLLRIHDGQPPQRPPRPIPPRPLPRHLTNPTPRRRWNTDLATVTRTGRVRAAYARITRRAAT